MKGMGPKEMAVSSRVWLIVRVVGIIVVILNIFKFFILPPYYIDGALLLNEFNVNDSDISVGYAYLDIELKNPEKIDPYDITITVDGASIKYVDPENWDWNMTLEAQLLGEETNYWTFWDNDEDGYVSTGDQILITGLQGGELIKLSADGYLGSIEVYIPSNPTTG